MGEVEKRFRTIPDTTTLDEIIHYMGDVWVLPWVLGVNNTAASIPQNGSNAIIIGSKSALYAFMLNGSVYYATAASNSWKQILATNDHESLWNHISYADSQFSYLKSSKSDVGHTHDDRYYTESEINSKINTINTNINNCKFRYVSDLLTDEFIYPQLVRYDVNTLNTPYKAGISGNNTEGFGISWTTGTKGQTSYFKTVFVIQHGGPTKKAFIYTISANDVDGWKAHTL